MASPTSIIWANPTVAANIGRPYIKTPRAHPTSTLFRLMLTTTSMLPQITLDQLYTEKVPWADPTLSLLKAGPTSKLFSRPALHHYSLDRVHSTNKTNHTLIYTLEYLVGLYWKNFLGWPYINCLFGPALHRYFFSRPYIDTWLKPALHQDLMGSRPYIRNQRPVLH